MKIRIVKHFEVNFGIVTPRWGVEIKQGRFSPWETIWDRYLTLDEAEEAVQSLKEAVRNNVVKEIDVG